MTNVKSKRHRLYSVTQIDQNGVKESTWVEKSAFRATLSAPVVWYGQPAQLHFWCYDEGFAVNQDATDLFARAGFVIRGPVLIRTGDELFYCVNASGNREMVEDALDGLGLSDKPIISSWADWLPYTNIYVRNRNDAFALKMRLP